MIIQNMNSSVSEARVMTIDVKNTFESNDKNDSKDIDRKRHSVSKMEKQASLTQLKKQQKDVKHLFQSLQNTTQQPSHPSNNPPQPPAHFKIGKSSSQPRIRTFKQQILRIPRVKQILQKDKFVYQQDIEKRLELIGDVKNENYTPAQVIHLKQLHKPVQKQKKKSNKRHRTNYKIPLTRQNIHSLNKLIETHISHNQHYKNEEFVFLSEKDYKEPFDLKKLNFMDEINPLKKKYKEKFPELKEGVLAKNKLLLEHVILSRNVKREMRLDQKKRKKEAEEGEKRKEDGKTIVKK